MAQVGVTSPITREVTSSSLVIANKIGCVAQLVERLQFTPTDYSLAIPRQVSVNGVDWGYFAMGAGLRRFKSYLPLQTYGGVVERFRRRCVPLSLIP